MKLNWSQCALALLLIVALATAAFALLPIEQSRTICTALLVFALAGGIYVGFAWSKEAAESDPESPVCLLYTSPSPRDKRQSRMPSSA